MRKVHAELFAAMPDYHMHTDEVLARPDSNTVAVHFTATGGCEVAGGRGEGLPSE